MLVCQYCLQAGLPSDFKRLGNPKTTKSEIYGPGCGECRRTRQDKKTPAAKARTAERDRVRNQDPDRRQWDRDYHRLRRYGVTGEWFQATLSRQNNCCAICGVPEPTGNRDWCLDHDHITGEPRGVLCHLCNLGLGYFQDDTSRLSMAVKYLEGFQS